tara:strand:+ start:2745 stop:5240 length:2496 start_codon:yes stop_codon:yes gene_type:complete
MAIEKGLYDLPEGIEDMEEGEAMMAIDVMSDEGVEVVLENGDVEITFGGDSAEDEELAPFGANLAEYLEDEELTSIATELVGYVESDMNSRKEWADTYVAGLEAVGLKMEQRTLPWEDACGVYSTVLAEANIRFQAEAMSETFPASGPVQTKIIGEITKDKEDAALRVKTDMNYELTEVMTEYRPEHERMLYSLGLAGSAFKKVYFDPSLGRQVALYIPAEDVIVPYGASTIEQAERVTHVMRKTKHEMMTLQAAGFYKNIDLGEPVPYHSDIEEQKAEEGGYSLTDDDRYCVYEINANLIIEGVDVDDTPDGYQLAKPYVVTIERGSNEVLGIRRNWEEEDPLMLKRQHFVHYVYVPGFGFYGLGLIHIIGGYAKAGTSLIRQLVDAGTLSNLPGGLKTRGLRVKGDDTPIGPGEFRDVDVPSGSIRDNILPLPYKEPSQTLLALLDKITNEGRRLGAISDMSISDMSANAPVGTTLALLERTLKPMAAVQSRVHYAMKQEFKLLRKIIAEYAPTEYEYIPERGEARARQDDYAMVEVIPVSDPNSSTMAQRVIQYQTVMQMASAAPEIYDLPQLHRQMIEILGIQNADKLVPTAEDMIPTDPVSENMNALTGTPMKAVIFQDHDAHIATHQAFMQDPQIMAFIGQNPAAQQIMSALTAHIGEHVAFSYRQQMENTLGVPLPAPDAELPEDQAIQLAQLMAQAGQQLSQQKQAAAAQQQAQQKAEDPIIKMQQEELQLKKGELVRKAAKDAMDGELSQGKLDLDTQKATNTATLEASRIASQNDQAQAKNDLAEAKAIMDAAKERSDAQRTEAEAQRDRAEANRNNQRGV